MKAVEYKDTNTFGFSPKYEYPPQIRGRWLQFHGLSKKYIKTLNYAIKFRQAGRLLAVYLYGNINNESLAKYLGKVGSEDIRVFVLSGIDEIIKAFDEYEALMAQFKCWGYVTNGELNENYYWHINHFSNEETHVWQSTIENYKTAHSAISQIIHSGTYDNGAPIEPKKHYEYLFEVAKTIYRYGIEADTKDEIAYKTIAIGRLMDSIRDGDTVLRERYGIRLTDTNMQLSIFDSISAASVAINDTLSMISHTLESRKRINTAQIVWYLAQNYGWYPQNNYYGYVLGYVLNEIGKIKDVCIYDGYATWDYTQDFALTHAANIAKDIKSKRHNFELFIDTEEAKRLSKVLFELFDLNGKNTPSYPISLHKGLHTTTMLIRSLGSKITRFGYADICEELYVVLNIIDPIYDTRYREYAMFFEVNLKQLKEMMRNHDKKMTEKLIAIYGEREANFIISFYAFEGACHYFWKKGEFMERAEKYHNTLHCYECGRLIQHSQGYEKNPDSPSGCDVIDFTQKEIVGLNKKIFGREADKMYCLECILEMMNTTPLMIKEIIERYKSEGCTLF